MDPSSICTNPATIDPPLPTFPLSLLKPRFVLFTHTLSLYVISDTFCSLSFSVFSSDWVPHYPTHLKLEHSILLCTHHRYLWSLIDDIYVVEFSVAFFFVSSNWVEMNPLCYIALILIRRWRPWNHAPRLRSCRPYCIEQSTEHGFRFGCVDFSRFLFCSSLLVLMGTVWLWLCNDFYGFDGGCGCVLVFEWNIILL